MPDGRAIRPDGKEKNRPMRSMIFPGQEWLDTEGKPIQAHGGSLLYEDGLYYWYGENKEKTHGGNGIWHWGVRCYRSADLVNWEDCGVIIPPDEADPTSPLHPSSMMDRPHILFNRRTGKYVCWLKIMEKNGEQTETVLTADRLLGPYTLVRRGLHPLGMSAGDFDLAAAPDGKAYYFFERVHSETIIADLTGDYTDVTGYYSTHFPHTQPPFVREATAHFSRHGRHYLITSGCPTPQSWPSPIPGTVPTPCWAIRIPRIRQTPPSIPRFPPCSGFPGRRICISPWRTAGRRSTCICATRITVNGSASASPPMPRPPKGRAWTS